MRISRISPVWPFVALAAILVLGTYLRLNGLLDRDYWYDEAFTGITVRQPFFRMLSIVIHDVHPPFYYLLLKAWTVVAGSSAFSIRFFSAFFGIATIGLAFAAVRAWHRTSWLPAVLGALVIAVNPFLVNYSQEARMYSLLGFLLLATAYLLTLSWQTASTKLRILYGIVLLFAVLTHYLGVIFAIIFVLVDAWRTRRPTATWLASGYLIPLLGGLAWLPFFAVQSERADGSLGWVPLVTLEHLPASLHILLFGGPVGVLGVPPALGYRVDWLSVEVVGVVILALIGFFLVWLTATRRWNWALALTAVLALGPITGTFCLQYLDLQLYVERYLVGCAIFLTLFLALAVVRLRIAPVLALYLLLVALVAPWQHVATHAPLARAVEQAMDGRPVVYTDALAFIVGRFYLGEQHRGRILMYAPEPFVGWALIEEADQTTALPTESHLIVTTRPNEYPGYRTVDTINDVTILESL